MTASARRATIAWLIAFGVLLVCGSGLIGELSGSFADSDGQFDAIHGTQTSRLRFIGGGILLTLAALAGVPAIVGIVARNPPTEWNLSQLCAFAFAILFATLLVACAASYATVSASREFGNAFDDTDQFRTGAWVLPQLATVLFAYTSGAAAAVIISLRASLHETSRRTALRRSGIAAAVLLLLSFAAPPLMGLLPLWLLAAVLARGWDPADLA